MPFGLDSCFVTQAATGVGRGARSKGERRVHETYTSEPSEEATTANTSDRLSMAFFRFLLALGLGLSVYASALAKEVKGASSGSPAKVAWVDMQAAILQTEEGKAAKTRIEKEAEGKRNSLLAQQQELKKLDDEFQEKQSVLSEADKVAKTRDFQSKLQKLREAQMGFEQEVRAKEMKETQKIFQNLAEIVEDVAKKRGYEMIFERNAGALLYAARIDDITLEVVQVYNQKFKVKK